MFFEDNPEKLTSRESCSLDWKTSGTIGVSLKKTYIVPSSQPSTDQTKPMQSPIFKAIFFRTWKQVLPLQWNVFLPNFRQLRSRQHLQLFTFQKLKLFPSNCSKITVECDWNSKIFQNFQKFSFSKKMAFPIKNWRLLKTLKVEKWLYNMTKRKRFLKTFKNLGFFQKIDEFFDKNWIFSNSLKVQNLL